MSACFHINTVQCDNCRPRSWETPPMRVEPPRFEPIRELTFMPDHLGRIATALERIAAAMEKSK